MADAERLSRPHASPRVSEHALVLMRSTFPDEAAAKAAARRLIEKRVAACIHVQPIWSTYRWKGAIEEDQEWLVEARTTADKRDACWGALLDGHPYDTPMVEILGDSVVPARYAQWAERCVADQV